MISLSDFDQSPEDGSSSWAVEKHISDQLTIDVDNVSIRYHTTYAQSRSLKEILVGEGQGRKKSKIVTAVDGVSFQVNKGTILGVVGHNGAGKSTLLKAIAGILPPSEGALRVKGQVSTLLSLGIGFNSSLSGVENIMLAGLASGKSREEVSELKSAIIEFAELAEFINFPVRTYSKGMGGRLAFSVAVHMDPEILLIDEALSAGDARFKIKAQEKMNELMNSAHTLVVVSHALGTISELCNSAIWMDHGKLMMHGKPNEVVDAYSNSVNVSQSKAVLEDF